MVPLMYGLPAIPVCSVQSIMEVRFRKTVESPENSVAKDAGEVSEFCVIYAYVAIHG